jgi:hypothetical protein
MAGIDISSWTDSIIADRLMEGIYSRSVLPSSYTFSDYKSPMNLNPKQIIFQPEKKMTIVVWNDNTRTTVKCSGEDEFIPEVGFAMALVKKMFPNRRGELIDMINDSYRRALKSNTKKEKKTDEKQLTEKLESFGLKNVTEKVDSEPE